MRESRSPFRFRRGDDDSRGLGRVIRDQWVARARPVHRARHRHRLRREHGVQHRHRRRPGEDGRPRQRRGRASRSSPTAAITGDKVKDGALAGPRRRSTTRSRAPTSTSRRSRASAAAAAARRRRRLVASDRRARARCRSRPTTTSKGGTLLDHGSRARPSEADGTVAAWRATSASVLGRRQPVRRDRRRLHQRARQPQGVRLGLRRSSTDLPAGPHTIRLEETYNERPLQHGQRDANRSTAPTPTATTSSRSRSSRSPTSSAASRGTLRRCRTTTRRSRRAG